MTYIKRLVMKGFKSFPRKTEIPFTPGINVILGPNGSGKSNISDALCFVFGRLSIKSMRAAKSKNLIFLGTKAAPPAKEAAVEVVFDNSNQTFSVDKNEISIKRIVRKNGQSIYKINNETKTRQEILTLLSQAGIDPHGFNIILQGEIQDFVKMHGEERRKVIEEVSGISVYEIRKQKSLKELEKTEERLKEITTTLRERTSYLNNLEKERQQALHFKKLESDLKRYKASIIYNDLAKKKKEKEQIELEISKKGEDIEKIKKTAEKIRNFINESESKISSINLAMQKSTGIEQEKLNREIVEVRANLEGLKVKLENSEKRLSEMLKQKKEFEETIKNNEISVKELRGESPSNAKKQKEIESKKKELDELEKQRKKFYTVKSEIKSVRDRIEDKRVLFQNYSDDSNFLVKQIRALSLQLFDPKSDKKKMDALKSSLSEKKELLGKINRRGIELGEKLHTKEYEIEKQNKLIKSISKIDICPLCKSKMTPEHIIEVKKEAMSKIDSLKKDVDDSDRELNEIGSKKKMLEGDIEQIESEIQRREADLGKILDINGKKEQIKVLEEKIKDMGKEVSELEKRRKYLEADLEKYSDIEKKCEIAGIEIQEISSRTKENISTEISLKQRELERSKIYLKQILANLEESTEEIADIKKNLKQKQEVFEAKKKQEDALVEKCQKMIAEKDDIQKKVRSSELDLSTKQNESYNIEQKINDFKIEIARVNAITENLEKDMQEYGGVEIIKISREVLAEKISKTQDVLSKIAGSVNLKSLEVYDSIKKEYDQVKEKVEIIAKEKDSVLKIVHDIDIRKKKSFLKTFNDLNETFSKNFSQLSTKGQVSLEIENKKDPFEGGVDITVKTGHGKYFDVTSLSGGEQTLVALSLIFAIQEYNPYHFYILDEIDAALDKRNSERLAQLLQRYMKKGQYIVITHNDEIITRAQNLYGISMFEGISKVISLRI